jgi:hypothetical protein
MNLPERSMSALRGVFGWIAGALVAGLVIKIVVLATGLDGFSDIIAAISILLVGRHGGQKMMTEGRIPSAANLWTAGTATAVISTLGGGSVGLLGAGLAIGGLAWGLKGGARA